MISRALMPGKVLKCRAAKRSTSCLNLPQQISHEGKVGILTTYCNLSMVNIHCEIVSNNKNLMKLLGLFGKKKEEGLLQNTAAPTSQITSEAPFETVDATREKIESLGVTPEPVQEEKKVTDKVLEHYMKVSNARSQGDGPEAFSLKALPDNDFDQFFTFVFKDGRRGLLVLDGYLRDPQPDRLDRIVAILKKTFKTPESILQYCAAMMPDRWMFRLDPIRTFFRQRTGQQGERTDLVSSYFQDKLAASDPTVLYYLSLPSDKDRQLFQSNVRSQLQNKVLTDVEHLQDWLAKVGPTKRLFHEYLRSLPDDAFIPRMPSTGAIDFLVELEKQISLPQKPEEMASSHTDKEPQLSDEQRGYLS